MEESKEDLKGKLARKELPPKDDEVNKEKSQIVIGEVKNLKLGSSENRPIKNLF